MDKALLAKPREEVASPVEVTDADFDSVVMRSAIPVVVEFWSPNCSHCQKMGPNVDALAAEFAGEVLVAKMNVLENILVPPKYGVSGIPAFFMIKNGEVAAKTLGAMSKGQLKKDLGLG